MPLKAQISPLKKRDLKELMLIARVYFGDQTWLTPEYLARVEKRAMVKLAVHVQKKIIGGALVVPAKNPNVMLELMVIDANFRRQGFGENLFTALERSLNTGQKLWYLAAENKNSRPGRKFLQKMGLEPAGHLHEYFGKNDALALVKVIR